MEIMVVEHGVEVGFGIELKHGIHSKMHPDLQALMIVHIRRSCVQVRQSRRTI